MPWERERSIPTKNDWVTARKVGLGDSKALAQNRDQGRAMESMVCILGGFCLMSPIYVQWTSGLPSRANHISMRGVRLCAVDIATIQLPYTSSPLGGLWFPS